MKRLLETGLIGIFLMFEASGKVRNIRVNDQKMFLIRLKIGKSTLLSFPTKPQKIVMGNSALFKVEFVGNELALNPKGIIETNLFVYTKKKMYAFLLKVNQTGDYDDLVHVRWEPRFRFFVR